MAYQPQAAKGSAEPARRFARPATAAKSIPSSVAEPVSSGMIAEPPAGGVPWEALKPDAATQAHLERTDPQIVSSVQEDARAKVLRTMNALRTLSPLIGQSMAQGGDDVAQANFFVQMMTKANELALEAAKQMGIDPEPLKNRWALNVLSRVFSESLASSKASAVPLSGTHLTQAVVRMASEGGAEKPEFPRGLPEVQVQLALFQALGPLLRAQNDYDFNRNRDVDLDTLMNLLLNRVTHAIPELVDPMARTEDRLTLFQVLLSEAGQGLASCWTKEALKLQAQQAHWTKGEAELKAKAFPQGFPIQEILDQFDHYFLRLIKITQQQVHPKSKAKLKGKA